MEVEEDVENGVATGAVEMIAVMEEATEEEETEVMGVGIMAEGAEETTAVTEAEGVATMEGDMATTGEAGATATEAGADGAITGAVAAIKAGVATRVRAASEEAEEEDTEEIEEEEEVEGVDTTPLTMGDDLLSRGRVFYCCYAMNLEFMKILKFL